MSSVTVTNVSADTINPSLCQVTTEVYTSIMSTTQTLAERMEALRNELGLTQEALAERGRASGLTRVQVVHVEGGRNQMNSKIICERYAQALWVTKEELDRFINSQQDPSELAQKIIKRGPPPWTTLDQPAALGTWGAHPMWEDATIEAKRRYKRVVTDDVVNEMAQFRSSGQMPQRLTPEWIHFQALAHIEAKEADGKLLLASCFMAKFW